MENKQNGIHLCATFRKQKSRTIAVVIPEVVNDFFGPVINGIESIAQEKGYHVLIYLTHEDRQKEVAITKLLQNGRVDGIMMSLSEQTLDTTHLEALKEMDIPLVFFDRIVDRLDAPKVTTDNYNCGIKATKHLIENGCSRIAFLSISKHLSISNKRMEGYLEALRRNDIPPNSALIVSCDSDEAKNARLIQELLKRENRPDGIFASVEKLAILTYKICEELQLNIPKDVKVITFSNSYTAAFLNPSLTTITQPAYEMGREATAVLFKLIEKKKHYSPPENIVLNSTLIAGNSTKGERENR